MHPPAATVAAIRDPSSRRGFAVTAAAVWHLAWPAILHLSLLTSVFVVDRALVGRLGADGLAAMHGATTISWTVASVLGAVSVGALATVGAHAGANRHREAAHAARGAIVLATGLAVVLAAVLWLTRDMLLLLLFPALGHAAHLQASRYLAVILPALPLGLFATAAAACLHALRDTRTPLMAAMWGTLVNIVVSIVLVFGLWGLPALGVAGAAAGTALAFATQALWLAVRLPRAMPRQPLRWRDVWRVSRPVFAERSAYHGSYLVYAGLVGALGPVAMAAHQGLLGIEAFSFTIAEGFGVAAGALAAQHVGAGRLRRARQTAIVAMALSCAALSSCAVLLYTFGEALAAWLCCDGVVARELLGVLPIAAVTQPFVALAVVGSAALRGTGRTREALGVTLIGAVIVRLGVAHGLADDLQGAWIAALADWAAQALLLGAWLLRRQTVPSPAVQPATVGATEQDCCGIYRA